MALWGTSTVTFLRLWTRAPRTRKVSCSGFEMSADAVICWVAKGKPRQQVSKLLPKLQIIKRLSKPSKRRVCTARSALSFCPERLRFLVEDNLADSAGNLQVNRHGRFPVGLVRVRAAFLL